MSASIFVVTGPSGVGKGTVCDGLLARIPNLVLSVSATSRPKRAHEKDGVNYHFKTRAEFEAMIDHDRQEPDPEKHILLEWAEYNGNYYGTPRQAVEDALACGQSVLLEIETQGALMVKARFPQACLIFLAPPSYGELERRLRSRGTDSDEDVARRLRISQREMALQERFDYVVINDHLATCISRLAEIVTEVAAPEKNAADRAGTNP